MDKLLLNIEACLSDRHTHAENKIVSRDVAARKFFSDFAEINALEVWEENGIVYVSAQRANDGNTHEVFQLIGHKAK